MRRLPGCFWNMVILNFQISWGSVATYLSRGGSHNNIYIKNFLTNTSVKEFWKLFFICHSYGQKSKELFFKQTSTPLRRLPHNHNTSHPYRVLSIHFRFKKSVHQIATPLSEKSIKDYRKQTTLDRGQTDRVSTDEKCNRLCPSVRLFVSTVTFEPSDLWPWPFACVWVMTIALLELKIKVWVESRNNKSTTSRKFTRLRERSP